MGILRMVLCGVLLASAVFNFIIPIYFRNKKNQATKYFSWFSVCVAIYSLGYAMELYSNTLPDMLFWNFVQYIGIPFFPAFWILFSLEYSSRKINSLTKYIIFTVPVLTFALRVTSSINHLYYSEVKLSYNGYFPVLYIEKGPWYWSYVIFITFCFLFSNYLYLSTYFKTTGAIRRQSLIMILACIFPWSSVFLNAINIAPLKLDYGAFSIAFAIVLFFVAFMRYQFLNIKPLARDKIFELTKDGIIVLDINFNIIDFNKAANAICPMLTQEILDIETKEVFRNYPKYQELVDAIYQHSDEECEITLEESKGNFKVSILKISEAADWQVGYIVTLTDITTYRNIMEELNQLASKDSLTNVYNRRYFVNLSTMELEKSKRYTHSIAMLILDLDFFKQVNDKYGHLAGDEVLKTVAEICRKTIRVTDILGRYGGEEFVIFFPETTFEDSYQIGERILNEISGTPTLFEGKEIKVTASIGITGIPKVTTENLDKFLKFADQALYTAKAEGRNCIRTIKMQEEL